MTEQRRRLSSTETFVRSLCEIGVEGAIVTPIATAGVASTVRLLSRVCPASALIDVVHAAVASGGASIPGGGAQRELMLEHYCASMRSMVASLLFYGLVVMKDVDDRGDESRASSTCVDPSTVDIFRLDAKSGTAAAAYFAVPRARALVATEMRSDGLIDATATDTQCTLVMAYQYRVFVAHEPLQSGALDTPPMQIRELLATYADMMIAYRLSNASESNRIVTMRREQAGESTEAQENALGAIDLQLLAQQHERADAARGQTDAAENEVTEAAQVITAYRRNDHTGSLVDSNECPRDASVRRELGLDDAPDIPALGPTVKQTRVMPLPSRTRVEVLQTASRCSDVFDRLPIVIGAIATAFGVPASTLDLGHATSSRNTESMIEQANRTFHYRCSSTADALSRIVSYEIERALRRPPIGEAYLHCWENGSLPRPPTAGSIERYPRVQFAQTPLSSADALKFITAGILTPVGVKTLVSGITGLPPAMIQAPSVGVGVGGAAIGGGGDAKKRGAKAQGDGGDSPAKRTKDAGASSSEKKSAKMTTGDKKKKPKQESDDDDDSPRKKPVGDNKNKEEESDDDDDDSDSPPSDKKKKKKKPVGDNKKKQDDDDDSDSSSSSETEEKPKKKKKPVGDNKKKQDDDGDDSDSSSKPKKKAQDGDDSDSSASSEKKKKKKAAGDNKKKEESDDESSETKKPEKAQDGDDSDSDSSEKKKKKTKPKKKTDDDSDSSSSSDDARRHRK